MKRYPRAEKQIAMNAESVAEAVDVTARMYDNIMRKHGDDATLIQLFAWEDTPEPLVFWECYNFNESMRI